MTREEFDGWCRSLKLSKETRAEVERIRSSPPARRVQSGPRNVKGHFNRSRVMDHTIQFESHTVEFPAIVLMEFDEEGKVLEMWDQPCSFTVHYKHPDGRNRAHLYTADFFVLRKGEAGWEEWKTEEDLVRLSKQNPKKYFRDENGLWRFPPGEGYARQFPPLYFKVRSSSDINWNLVRNYKLLKPIIDNEEDALC